MNDALLHFLATVGAVCIFWYVLGRVFKNKNERPFKHWLDDND